jgi:hypothetical protein
MRLRTLGQCHAAWRAGECRVERLRRARDPSIEAVQDAESECSNARFAEGENVKAKPPPALASLLLGWRELAQYCATVFCALKWASPLGWHRVIRSTLGGLFPVMAIYVGPGTAGTARIAGLLGMSRVIIRVLQRQVQWPVLGLVVPGWLPSKPHSSSQRQGDCGMARSPLR